MTVSPTARLTISGGNNTCHNYTRYGMSCGCAGGLRNEGRLLMTDCEVRDSRWRDCHFDGIPSTYLHYMNY